MKTKKELEKIFLSMGYRRLVPNKPSWAKPFAFTVLCINIQEDDKIFIRQYFYGCDGKLYIWDSKELKNNKEENDVLNQIKYFEMYDYHSFNDCMSSLNKFDFLTKQQEIEMILND